MKKILRIRLLKLNVGPFTFSPGIIPTIVTLFFIYIMLILGKWQADKGDYKQNLEQTIVARMNLPTVTMDELPKSIDDRLFLPVTAYGQYDTERYFLLDNKILKGRVGYDVYTPFYLADGSAILVNRGFLPLGSNRKILPAVITPGKPLSIKGLLDKIPSRTVVLADDVNPFISWPVVLQYIDTEEIKSMLGQPVSDMIIRLDENEDHGFTRVLPALDLNSAKNIGYAFQWYAMTVALIIIYFVTNTKRRNTNG